MVCLQINTKLGYIVIHTQSGQEKDFPLITLLTSILPTCGITPEAEKSKSDEFWRVLAFHAELARKTFELHLRGHQGPG